MKRLKKKENKKPTRTAGSPPRRSRNKNRRKRRIMTLRFFLIIILLAILAKSGYAVISDYRRISLDKSVTFTIESGTGAKRIAQILKENGVIKYPNIFLLCAKNGGYAQRFKAGSTTVNPGASYTDICDLLIQDNRNMTKVTIPEGFEVRMIIDRLEEAGVINREKFVSLLDASRYDYKFLKDIPKRSDNLEGYLFPDTYYIYPEDSEEDIIKMMLDAFDAHFKPEYYDRAKELDMSVDDIVKLASIIERETDSDEERSKVAGVFYNRIKKKMKLQSCATVQYILKERKPNLSNEDTKIDSPYNTYKYDGLPEGPIACPGIECIRAALYPEDTKALFFVQGADGKHIFSETYEQHLKAKGSQ